MLVSIGDRRQQRGEAWAVLLSLRSFNFTVSSIETRPAARSHRSSHRFPRTLGPGVSQWGQCFLAEVLVQAEGKGLWSSRHGDCSRGDGSSGPCRCCFRLSGGLPTSTDLQFFEVKVDFLWIVSLGALLYV